jgi:hypothetical protein
LFRGKYWSEVMWIYISIGAISSFGVDIEMASKGVRLGSQTARVEVDDEVKTGEKFQPTSLSLG